MARLTLASLTCLALTALAQPALAARSAELYTTKAYGFGRIEARVRFAQGDGVIGSFFMWKDGSEQAGTFWNELDFEKLGADCHLQTNPIYGNPSKNHSQTHKLTADLCGQFHTYAYEWTPDYIAWFVDDSEIRRETGAAAMAYATNASQGMEIHFNVWPGDATFGGNFNPSILPVHEYVDWVQYSSYSGGTFKSEWREDFNGSTLPAGWVTGNWMSPKNLSTHDAGNVNLLQGCVVLSLTADNAVGPAGAIAPMPGCCIIGDGPGVAAGGWPAPSCAVSTKRSQRLPQRTASPCLNRWLCTRCSWKYTPFALERSSST